MAEKTLPQAKPNPPHPRHPRCYCCRFGLPFTSPKILGLNATIRHSKNSSLANIHQFEDTLVEKLWLLDTRPPADASIRDEEKDYLSVDYFLYDRCCVVANGKDFYEEVLHDPSQFPTGLSFERLLSVADLAYERKTGKAFVHIPRKSYETYSNEAGWEDAD